MQRNEQNIVDKITQIKAAIDYEVTHLYINAVGRSGTFADFIKKECESALKVYRHSTKWAAVRALIKRYEFVDLVTRMGLIKQIKATILELEDFYTDNPNELIAMGDNQNNFDGKYETEFDQKNKLNKFSNDDDKNTNKLNSSLNQTANLQNSKHVFSKSQKPNSVKPGLDMDISEIDLKFLKGVGPALAERLNSLEIFSCEDLLHYLPRKHVSYEDKVPISALELEQDVTIIGEIHKVTAFKSPRKNLVILTIIIKDPSGKIKVTKFLKGNSTHLYLKQFKKQYPEGVQVLCSGTVKKDKFSKQLHIANAMIEIISGDFTEGRDNIHTGRIVPIYPLTEGLSLMQVRKVIYNALDAYQENLKEFLPQSILGQFDLMPYAEAIREIHFPSTIEKKDRATERLIFNEFFLMQLRFALKRSEIKREEKNIHFNCFENGLVDKFINSLPFKLTYAQERVFFTEILPDLISKFPMHRLLQGDVGCGKTVVAFMTLLVAVDNAYQAALMVPTEILAEQHFRSFSKWAQALDALGIRIGFLTGSMRAKEKREMLEALANGLINIVIGTHALIQEGVQFHNLGLVIIDEQHRFGVKQRDLLIKKGASQEGINVERLFMTATPIPRTLALSMHGDLDLSEIDEMPPGRKPAITTIVKRKADAYQIIRDEIMRGRQAYIVFPLIDESESLSAKAAKAEFEKLKKEIFQDFKLGLMHGKLPDDEKDRVMQEFREGKIDVLISTTVIEVGVDVPNATVMMVESAERFGLAQLHQLRGRVGRAEYQSYCMLSTDSRTEQVLTRLNVLTTTNNGFIVAQQDMKLRGAGDFLGTRQSGLPDFALASIVDHEDMLVTARNAARSLLAEDSELSSLDCALLKKKLGKSSQEALLVGG